jgi:hypothetical protein
MKAPLVWHVWTVSALTKMPLWDSNPHEVQVYAYVEITAATAVGLSGGSLWLLQQQKVRTVACCVFARQSGPVDCAVNSWWPGVSSVGVSCSGQHTLCVLE